MNATFRKIATAIVVAAGLAAVAPAYAGYYDYWGNYHVTCVPGYWAPGPYGPIWVPPVCG